MTDQTTFRLVDLAQNRATDFDIRPSSQILQPLAQELELIGLRKVRLSGRIAAQGAHNWTLNAQLGATVTQPCVVTLDPVNTRIEAEVRRLYVKDFENPDDPETEMPDDEATEPLPTEIDLLVILAEALALNLPQYPRKDGADLGEAVFAEPGKQPLRDDDAKPFAGLANLRDQLKRDS